MSAPHLEIHTVQKQTGSQNAHMHTFSIEHTRVTWKRTRGYVHREDLRNALPFFKSHVKIGPPMDQEADVTYSSDRESMIERQK